MAIKPRCRRGNRRSAGVVCHKWLVYEALVVPPQEALRAHEQRAKLIHTLVDAFDLEVKKWDGRINGTQPYEVVEIIIALGSAGVFTAMVSAMKIWVEKKKIKDITIWVNKYHRQCVNRLIQRWQIFTSI